MEYGSDDRLKQFQKGFDDAFKFCSTFAKDWRYNRKVYKADYDEDEVEDNKSRLRVMWAWQQIQSEIPRIMTVDPVFDFEPVEKNDRQYGDALRELVKSLLYLDDFVMKQIGIIEMGAVEGLAITKTTQKRVEKTMKVHQKRTMGQKVLGKSAEPVEKKLLLENRANTELCDIFDVFWNQDAVDFSSITKVYHRNWKSLKQIKALGEEKVYENTDKIEELSGWGFDGNYNIDHSTKQGQRRKDKYPVIEQWDTEDNTLMVVCGNVILYDGPNPYFHMDHPFSFFCTQPEVFCVPGMSECAAIDHIQQAIHTVDNQRIEAVSLALNNVLVVDPNLEDQDIVFGPGEIIYANHGHRLDQLRFDANQIPALNESQALVGYIQQMTGMNAYMIGADPTASGINQNTAYGARTLTEGGNQRMIIKNTSFQVFQARIAKLMVQLSHQYLSATELLQLLGDKSEDFRDMQPEEIPMFIHVRPHAISDQMNKVDKLDSLMQVLNVTGNLHLAPMGDGSVFTVKPFIDDLIETSGLQTDSAYVPEPPPMPEEAPVG